MGKSPTPPARLEDKRDQDFLVPVVVPLKEGLSPIVNSAAFPGVPKNRLYHVQFSPAWMRPFMSHLPGRSTQFTHVRVDWCPERLRSPGGITSWSKTLGYDTMYKMDSKTWWSYRMTDVYVKHPQKPEFTHLCSLEGEMWGIHRSLRNSKLTHVVGSRHAERQLVDGNSWISLTYYVMLKENYLDPKTRAGKIVAEDPGNSGADTDEFREIAETPRATEGDVDPDGDDVSEPGVSFQQSVLAEDASPAYADRYDIAADDTPGTVKSDFPDDPFNELDWVNAYHTHIKDLGDEIPKWGPYTPRECRQCGAKSNAKDVISLSQHCTQCDPTFAKAFVEKVFRNGGDTVQWGTAVSSVARALCDPEYVPYVFCGGCDLEVAEAQALQDCREEAVEAGVVPRLPEIPDDTPAAAMGLTNPRCRDCSESPPQSNVCQSFASCRACVGKACNIVSYQSLIGGSCYEDCTCPGFHSFPYNSECPLCCEANKLHRPHLRGKNKVPVIGDFSCDLVERRDPDEPIQFVLVGVNANAGAGVRKIPVVIPMANKSEPSCERAIRAMLLKAEHIWGAPPTKRLHSDGEAGITALDTKLHEIAISLTHTEGNDSQANGVAEGENAICTRTARSSIHAALRHLPKEARSKASRALWPYAMVHAADRRCIMEWKEKGCNDIKAMHEPRIYEDDMRPFLSRVIVRPGSGVKPDRQDPIGILAWYLHADPWVSRATKVLCAEAPYNISSYQSVNSVMERKEDPDSWIFPPSTLGLPPAVQRRPDFPALDSKKWIECSRCHKFRGVSSDLHVHFCAQKSPFQCCQLSKPDGTKWECATAEEKDAWDDKIARGEKKPKRRVRIKPIHSGEVQKRLLAARQKESNSKWYYPLPKPQKVVTRFHFTKGETLDVESPSEVTRCQFLPKDQLHRWSDLIRRETFDMSDPPVRLEETVRGKGRRPKAQLGKQSQDQLSGEFVRVISPDPGESEEPAIEVKWKDVPRAERANLYDERRASIARLSRALKVHPSDIVDRTSQAFSVMLDWFSTEESIRIDEEDDLDVDPNDRVGDHEIDLGDVEWKKYRKTDIDEKSEPFEFDHSRAGWHNPLPESCSGHIKTEFVLDDDTSIFRTDEDATVFRTMPRIESYPLWSRVRRRITYDLGKDGEPIIADETLPSPHANLSKVDPTRNQIAGQGESDGAIPSPKALVNQMLRISDAKLRATYSETVGKEIGRMLQFSTWGPPIARSLIPDIAWVYRVNMLYGIKNAEHPDRAKDKARLVLQGNLRFTKSGRLKLDKWYRTPGEFWAPASSMAGFRLIVAIGTILGHPVETIDLDAAYLQSKVRGEVSDYLEMTPEILEGMTPDWQIQIAKAREDDILAGGTGQVVFPLLRNMYGKTTSGYNFIGDLQSDLEALGWRRMPHCYGSFYKRCTHTGKIQVLANYVDDFAAALSPQSREAEWNAIGGPDGGKGGWVFDPPRLVDRFLGIECRYPEEGNYRWIILEQVHYMSLVIKRYEEAQKVKVPVTPLKNLPTDEPPLDKELKSESGTQIRSALGGLMYAARGTRPDILKACHTTSRRVTRWEAGSAKFFEKVLGYCKYHEERGLSFDCRNTSSDLADWAIHAFVDSSLDIPWSQSGVMICAAPRGENNGDDGPFLVLDYQSTGQEYVKLSPAESETVGLVQAARASLKYLFSWELIAPWNSDEQDCVYVHVDNAQAQAFAERGWSAALVHVARTYACNVLWVTERIRQGFFKILHEPTKRMLVDPLTKLMQPIQLVERGVLVRAIPAPVAEN